LTQTGGGSFLTLEPTGHFTTNADEVERFFGLNITTRQMDGNLVVDYRVE
jgi:hypothetical protein